ncbi:sigma-54 dependent transcriptional regulator [Temperatibacter marinus]|uniref:Sigma-54 dependent transcriptional regulator n=1 Tax=Temperatibacter marinus TaxID=1456591 RepID=A0AA52EIU3_9PROT|nr:sigma-54 dependent transcriptional regulator [Temperatibacter marinus]WND03327.1 sigma-54 dependent transcriptional regulator [Temperatibacter marinus]
MLEQARKILIIEPIAALAQLYKGHLESDGYKVTLSRSAPDALDLLSNHDFSLVVADSHIGQAGLTSLLAACNDSQFHISLLMLASQQEQKLITQIMKKGASDYLIKPVSDLRLLTTVHNVLERVSMKAVIKRYSEESDLTGFHGLIGSSVAMQTVYKTIRHVASGESPIYITGERGTGKLRCATAVHAASPRASKPFIAVDCASLAQKGLLEVTLFGDNTVDGNHLDGEKSVLRKANGGTLFLNEVDKLPMDVQEQLMDFIQTGKLEGHGLSSSEENMDVRIITGSVMNLKSQVWRGNFMESLYSYLSLLPVVMPPLRDRGSDVLALANHFLREIAEEENTAPVNLAPALIKKLKDHNWPGNVHELKRWLSTLVSQRKEYGKNFIPPFTTMKDDDFLGTNVVSIHLQQAANAEEFSAHTCKLEEFERWIIESRIRAKGGSIPKAAESLGISPSTIYRKRESWCKDIGMAVS